MKRPLASTFACLASVIAATSAVADAPPGLLKSEFIYETAPFPAVPCLDHRGDRAAALSPRGSAARARGTRTWASGCRARRRASGPRPSRWPTASSRRRQPRYPCWNPVLFQPKAGPAAAVLQGRPQPEPLVGHADDLGRWRPNLVATAAAARGHPRPDQEQAGAARQRRHPLPDQHRASDGWRVHFERTPDLGQTWSRTAPRERRQEDRRHSAQHPVPPGETGSRRWAGRGRARSSKSGPRTAAGPGAR